MEVFLYAENQQKQNVISDVTGEMKVIKEAHESIQDGFKKYVKKEVKKRTEKE